MQSDRAEIDAMMESFFGAFDTTAGPPPIERLYDLFLPQAVIVKNVGAVPEAYGVERFVEPRRELLTGGAIDAFREWETSGKTEILGNIAHRRSFYEKSWSSGGKSFSGRGVKSLQFVRTPSGWRIASLTWDDNDLQGTPNTGAPADDGEM